MSPPGCSIPIALILILGVSVSAVSAPTPGVLLHPVVLLWALLTRLLRMSLNSSWSTLFRCVCAGIWGPTQLDVPGTHHWTSADWFGTSILGHLLLIFILPFVPSHPFHTLWALAAFSLQSWFQNQLEVRPLGPSLMAGSDMVLNTLPEWH